MTIFKHSIAVVIPCYRVKKHIITVLSSIGPEVSIIYVVDDCCPENTGDYVISNFVDPRVVVYKHEFNQGVGAAVLTGYRAAILDNVDVIVKIDGDGQMDPNLIPIFVEPILSGRADYTKGNRFFNLEDVMEMPKIRIFGNAVLSLLTKLSSGYWGIFDPTNGYTAIHSSVANFLPLSKISNRYFFESDMLFRLNTIRAVVLDVPMSAKYSDEISNLKISKVIFEFLGRHMKNFIKRIFYNYYLRDMSLASIELPVGITMLLFGLIFGFYNWAISIDMNIAAPTGTIMLSVLPILFGLQLILAFFAQDMSFTPKNPIHLILNKCLVNTRGHNDIKR